MHSSKIWSMLQVHWIEYLGTPLDYALALQKHILSLIRIFISLKVNTFCSVHLSYYVLCTKNVITINRQLSCYCRYAQPLQTKVHIFWEDHKNMTESPNLVLRIGFQSASVSFDCLKWTLIPLTLGPKFCWTIKVNCSSVNMCKSDCRDSSWIIFTI